MYSLENFSFLKNSSNDKKVLIFHNILWSSYKGLVFSKLNNICNKKQNGLCIEFVQIAETESERSDLRGVESDYHKYPYKLLIRGNYNSVGVLYRTYLILRCAFKSDARIFVIPGYFKIEYWVLLFYCKIMNFKVGVFCDSTQFDKKRNISLRYFAKRFFFKRVDLVFAYGRRSAEYAVQCGASLSSIVQRCQAAALPFSYSIEAVREARSAPVEPTFLYVGRLSPEKNLQRLIVAFAAARSQLLSGKIFIVGSGSEQIELEKTAADYGVSEYVVFLGSKSGPELYDLYSRATCLVLPSVSEPWGLVVNEALHSGCPVIVSNRCGCVPELVIDGKTGYTFDPENFEELAECLVQICTWAFDTATLDHCLNTIEPFSPLNAATSIYSGCESLVSLDMPGSLSRVEPVNNR